MKFSLIIPCFNEVKNLPLLLERCKRLASQPGVEIIFVDNGSSDGTKVFLENNLRDYQNCRSVRVEKNQGYGHGILVGLGVAKGEILGWTHADMQTDPNDGIRGLELFEQYGPNIFVKGARYGRPFCDQLFTIGMSIFESLLLRKRMWDINAQPTMFSKKFFDSWGSPPNDFALDLYAYFEARRSCIPVYRFPVCFGKRAHGNSHWNVNWKAKWKFIRRTFKYSINLKNKAN